MRLVATTATLALGLCLLACDDSTPAPSVRATCERLEQLCGELYGFEAGQCTALADMGSEPTSTERRCVGKADSCDEAFACRMGDGGLADAGAPPPRDPPDDEEPQE